MNEHIGDNYKKKLCDYCKLPFKADDDISTVGALDYHQPCYMDLKIKYEDYDREELDTQDE